MKSNRVVPALGAGFLLGLAGGYLGSEQGLLPPLSFLPGAAPAPVTSHPAGSAPDRPGLWRHRRPPPEMPDDAESLDETTLTRMLTLGYIDGSVPAPDASGVTVHVPSRAWPGLNLVVSGHAPGAMLMDMEGEILHRWSRDFFDVWPDAPIPEDRRYTQFWRRAHLYPDGDLLAVYDWLGLVRLDARGEVRWSYDGGAHHDVDVAEDGRIFVLDQEARVVPWLGREDPVLEEFVTVLSPEGERQARVSILEALRHSDYRSLLERLPSHRDILHTNTLELLQGRLADRLPAFHAGNVLLSIRTLDAVVVLDLEREQVVWALASLWHAQHQPTVLDSSHLLVFDNLWGPRDSRVVELDPVSQQIVWRYPPEEGPEPGFWSDTCGSNQRLENGNTLITESDNGRAIEVTPEGRIVWEYVNPHRAGEEDEFIATLLEVVRLPPDYAEGWLPPPTPDDTGPLPIDPPGPAQGAEKPRPQG